MSGKPPLTVVPKSPIRGELREWYQVGKMFRGRVYGDTQQWYKDGEMLSTAYVKYIEVFEEHYIVHTLSSQWLIYKSTANLEKGMINV